MNIPQVVSTKAASLGGMGKNTRRRTSKSQCGAGKRESATFAKCVAVITKPWVTLSLES